MLFSSHAGGLATLDPQTLIMHGSSFAGDGGRVRALSWYSESAGRGGARA
ncbi:MAG TPA: hypothetical protein VN622_02960 [Clostridia bacterium]|nr:hypothetical protein [Clostridia bacterium]